MKKIAIIIPCYQNQGSIPILADKLIALRDRLADRAQMAVVCVNDGSTDNTLAELMDFKAKAPDMVKIVNLSRNFGSYNAFLAGMAHSEGDCHVHLHADLQEPPELIEEMFAQYERGTKLVIAYRSAREDTEDVTLFASLYHFLVKRYAIRNVPKGGFDLILFDEQIREDIVAISEKNTNIVYLISWLGYPYVAIPYTRLRREHGTSQWTFWKNVKLFSDTFFSFSDFPVHVLRLACLLAIMASVLFGVYVAFFAEASTTLRWFGSFASAAVILLAVSLFVLAEYMMRVHETVRKRPNFVVNEVL